MTIDKIAYRGWPNCYRLSNGEIELVLTTDVGPRVLRCGFVNGQNLFYECEAQMGGTLEPWWLIRGGHRFWIAPETVPETYALDNRPCEITFPDTNAVCVTAPVEEETSLSKQLTISLTDGGTVHLTHQLKNHGTSTVQWAIWPATLLAPGGTAFAAFPERGSHDFHLRPTHPLVMWAYTDFSDPRWKFTKKHLILKQDPTAAIEQKAGLFNRNTFGAYLLNSELFAKRCIAVDHVSYADFHTSFQIFTNRDFMELETLGPLVQLAPGASAVHAEEWSLTRNVRIESWNDPELEQVRSLISWK